MSVIQTPLVYTERSSSIPRRKSCRACAKAKRRCDLLLPTCSRCSQRRLGCEYPLLMGASSVHAPPSFTATSQFFPGSVPDFNNLYIPAPLYHQPPPPIPPVLPYSYRNTRKLPWNSPLSLKLLFSAAMDRLHFMLGVFQNAHRTMVLENQTPWCHPLLWQNSMPRSMQDAYACCSMYMNRNASNSKTILSIIENRVADLLASGQPNTPTECLARLQALILYQTIRLFENDTSARLAADLSIPALQSSLTHFLETVHLEDTLSYISDLPMSCLIEEPSSSFSSSSSSSGKDFWQSWIFEESARRTMFLSHLLICIWEVLHHLSDEEANNNNKNPKKKNLTCDGRLGLTHCWWFWYLSSHLWESQNRYEFALAYTEKNRFLIRELDFTEFLVLGSPDDVDMLGKMVLSVLMGMDALRGWFSERGGNLDA